MSSPPWKRRFAAHLHRLHEDDDRAAFGALRRVLADDPIPALQHLGVYPPTRREQEAALLVAGLYASTQHADGYPPDSGGDLGQVLARVAREREMRGVDSASLESRFVALLKAHRDDLPHHLRRAVSLAHHEGVHVNALRLLDDLLAWDHPEQRVQHRWARAYWGATKETDDETTDTPLSE